MKCDNCKSEQDWLEIIGKSLICKKCIQKHKEMGLIYRTHENTFHFLIRRINPTDYVTYLTITRKQIEDLANLKKSGIKLPTTNVVRIE